MGFLFQEALPDPNDAFEPQEQDGKAHRVKSTGTNLQSNKFRFINLLQQGRTSSARATITKEQSQGALYNRIVLTHSSRGQNSKVKMSAGLASPEFFLPVYRWLSVPVASHSCQLCVCTSLAPLSLFVKTQVIMDYGLFLKAPFQYIYPFYMPVPKYTYILKY